MTRKEFLKLYHDLDNFNWLEGRKATNPEIFQITPEQIAELFPDRLEAVRYYRNIHLLDLDETLRLFPKKLVKISFCYGYIPPKNGHCEFIQWNDESYIKSELISNAPIYDFLNGKQIYDLCSGEIIEIEQHTLTRYFTEIQ